jgi:hypothetical protein
MVGQSPGIDRRHVGKNTSFQRFVDGLPLHPTAATQIGSAKLIGTAKLRAIKRSRIPTIGGRLKRDLGIVGKRCQGGLGGVESAQQDMDSGAVPFRRELAKLPYAGQLQRVCKIRSVVGMTGLNDAAIVGAIGGCGGINFIFGGEGSRNIIRKKRKSEYRKKKCRGRTARQAWETGNLAVTASQLADNVVHESLGVSEEH